MKLLPSFIRGFVFGLSALAGLAIAATTYRSIQLSQDTTGLYTVDSDHNLNLNGATITTGGVTSSGAVSGTAATFTTGLVGTTTNDSAGTGYVGQYVSSSIAVGSAVSLTTNTAANVTSVSLTAGDWDCRAVIARVVNGATFNGTYFTGTLSTTTADPPTTTTLAAGQSVADARVAGIIPANVGPTSNIPPFRFSLAATTTVYLVAYDTFSAGTDGAYGLLSCRRVR